jgi:hypothetical protein
MVHPENTPELFADLSNVSAWPWKFLESTCRMAGGEDG